MVNRTAVVVTARPRFVEELSRFLSAPVEVIGIARFAHKAVDEVLLHDPDMVIVDGDMAERIDVPGLIETLTESLAVCCTLVASNGDALLPAQIGTLNLASVVRRDGSRHQHRQRGMVGLDELLPVASRG